jgi:hypothetical protein
MTGESPQSEKSGLSLTVTVSSQPAFVPALEALAARVGEYVGCPAEDAKHLGQAVGRALGGVWRRLGPERSPGRFEIMFQGNGRLLRVDLACTSPLPAGVTLEEAFGGAEAVDHLRQLVDRLEFGDADGAPYCRLTRQIRDAR